MSMVKRISNSGTLLHILGECLLVTSAAVAC
uniref:Uncharacterized protein n=1 Tax=Rhizophora mucronata TaxID=61149 RepID=A0A2P2QQ87_RHIMU